ncbi:DUF6318 family protein [Ancrocorticia populi]|uniref:DUF6318 family protein n=2 Tax=Ancrocorticia populi TaxID=2175228 RepID=UPI003F94C2AF
MRHKGRALAGLLVALLMGLGACGGGSPATPTSQATAVQPSPTATSAVPTKPTGIEPPEKPAAMSTPDEDGAVAAAEYFLRMTTYAAATGDTTELEAMSGPDCQFCESYLESVGNLHDPEGGEAWATMPELEIEFADAKPTAETGQFQVNMRTNKSAYEYFDEEDGLQEASAESLVMVVVVTYSSSDSWIVEAAQDFPSDTEIPGENP